MRFHRGSFSLFTVIYSNVDSLGDWKREQVYFLLGIVFASDALFATFFQPNFWELNRLVNRGDLDALLTKPVSPVYLACTRRLNFTSILNFTLGIALIFSSSLVMFVPTMISAAMSARQP